MNTSSPIAWVAGATGYTGRALVAHARTSGRTVHAHIRPDSPQLARHRRHFEQELGVQVEVLAWDPDALREALARVRPTEVYALLGTTKAKARAAAKAGAKPADYAAVDVGLTLMLMNACLEAEIRPRFVYLSALGADVDASSEYMRARGQVEEALSANSLPYTILRPSFISGPDREERRLGERIGATLSDAILGVIGALGGRRIHDRYRSFDATTLARVLVDLAGNPATENLVIETKTFQG
ncbi:MAG TPA: NAD-dependent epimerase/dehydratase family protein [Nannocystis exedens]|nr:NAD-dependent epimerase/dehydratase family protein [Nannocystis exedens]